MQQSTIYCTTCGAGNRAGAGYCFSCGQAIHVGTAPGIAGTGRLASQQTLKQRYKIVTMVGKGGMGAVYKAEDIQFGNRLVALKEMSQSNLDQQEAKNVAEQFKQEAYMLAHLKHPNLPSIYDYFGEHGRWYLVMDFIEGTTLDARLDKMPGHALSVAETIEIGIQLAKVLGYLHSRPSPIIFRDLKPLNIMVTPEDNIYLIDFGIARLFKTGKAKDTIAYVSPGYAAPEQFGRTQTSPQSDIYSLGATLHQLLSGHEPNSNVPLFAFRPLTSYSPNIPPALSNLIDRMVDIDPDKRPASMNDIRKELESVQTQAKQGVTSTPPIHYAPSPPQAYTYPPPTQLLPYVPPPAQKQAQMYHAPSGQTPAKPALPKRRVRKTLLIGVVAGGLFYLLSFSLDPGLIGFIVVGIILFLIAGLITGRVAVQRRAGFFMGCVATLTVPIIEAIHNPYFIRYAPLSLLIELLVLTLVAGFIGLFGAWLATIRHPYYKKP